MAGRPSQPSVSGLSSQMTLAGVLRIFFPAQQFSDVVVSTTCRLVSPPRLPVGALPR